MGRIVDAKLDDYVLGESTNRIKVTFTGHTKGETIYKYGTESWRL